MLQSLQRGKHRELFPMCAPLSPHASIPISCNYPHWEAGRADLEEKGLNVRSYQCKMWFFGSSRLNWWWKMNAYFFKKRWTSAAKHKTRREKIRRPKTERKKIKDWNFTMGYLSSSGSHCCWCQPVKTPARSKVKSHRSYKVFLINVL